VDTNNLEPGVELLDSGEEFFTPSFTLVNPEIPLLPLDPTTPRTDVDDPWDDAWDQTAHDPWPEALDYQPVVADFFPEPRYEEPWPWFSEDIVEYTVIGGTYLQFENVKANQEEWYQWWEESAYDPWPEALDYQTVVPDIFTPLPEDPWAVFWDESAYDPWPEILDYQQVVADPSNPPEDPWVWFEDPIGDYSPIMIGTAAPDEFPVQEDVWYWFEDRLEDDWWAFQDYTIVSADLVVDTPPEDSWTWFEEFVDDPLDLFEDPEEIDLLPEEIQPPEDPWIWFEDSLGDHYSISAGSIINIEQDFIPPEDPWIWFDDPIGDYNPIFAGGFLPEDLQLTPEDPWPWFEEFVDNPLDLFEDPQEIDLFPAEVQFPEDPWIWFEDSLGDHYSISIGHASTTAFVPPEDAWPWFDEVVEDDWQASQDANTQDVVVQDQIQDDLWVADDSVSDDWADYLDQSLSVEDQAQDDPWLSFWDGAVDDPQELFEDQQEIDLFPQEIQPPEDGWAWFDEIPENDWILSEAFNPVPEPDALPIEDPWAIWWDDQGDDLLLEIFDQPVDPKPQEAQPAEDSWTWFEELHQDDLWEGLEQSIAVPEDQPQDDPWPWFDEVVADPLELFEDPEEIDLFPQELQPSEDPWAVYWEEQTEDLLALFEDLQQVDNLPQEIQPPEDQWPWFEDLLEVPTEEDSAPVLDLVADQPAEDSWPWFDDLPEDSLWPDAQSIADDPQSQDDSWLPFWDDHEVDPQNLFEDQQEIDLFPQEIQPPEDQWPWFDEFVVDPLELFEDPEEIDLFPQEVQPQEDSWNVYWDEQVFDPLDLFEDSEPVSSPDELSPEDPWAAHWDEFVEDPWTEFDDSHQVDNTPQEVQPPEDPWGTWWDLLPEDPQEIYDDLVPPIPPTQQDATSEDSWLVYWDEQGLDPLDLFDDPRQVDNTPQEVQPPEDPWAAYWDEHGFDPLDLFDDPQEITNLPQEAQPSEDAWGPYWDEHDDQPWVWGVEQSIAEPVEPVAEDQWPWFDQTDDNLEPFEPVSQQVDNTPQEVQPPEDPWTYWDAPDEDWIQGIEQTIAEAAAVDQPQDHLWFEEQVEDPWEDFLAQSIAEDSQPQEDGWFWDDPVFDPQELFEDQQQNQDFVADDVPLDDPWVAYWDDFAVDPEELFESQPVAVAVVVAEEPAQGDAWDAYWFDDTEDQIDLIIDSSPVGGFARRAIVGVPFAEITNAQLGTGLKYWSLETNGTIMERTSGGAPLVLNTDGTISTLGPTEVLLI